MRYHKSGRVKPAIALLLVAAALFLGPAGTTAQPIVQSQPGIPAGDQAALEPVLYFPLVAMRPILSYRLGYGVTFSGNVTTYPELPSLKAGLYLDWAVRTDAPRPNGMEYVQIVRVHQKLTCTIGTPGSWDRNVCPYIPNEYIVYPSLSDIAAVAASRRGNLWLVGNEMDRRDWDGGTQDEILPETYALSYHDVYTAIKTADPSARVAIGGVIQATPLRLEYLTKIWNTYQATYGGPMPVDVWNVHGFVLQEDRHATGADIPPGSSAETGMLYAPADHANMGIFANQIVAFRRWMRDRSQQNKPLIVSEYGVLYPTWYVPTLDQAGVQNFMLATFDYFLNTKDCSLGFPEDDCRLVQRWVWYSLDDPGNSNNPYGSLMNRDTLQLTATGAAFRQYSLSHFDQLMLPRLY